MIGFLNPLLWLAGLAAAIPIILHLIRRREVRRVSFPAVRYVRQAEQRHARRLRLRHLVLLATRVLIIILAAAAAAGPLIGRGRAGDHQPTAVAIVVDNSQSSARLHDDRRLFDHFIDRANLTLEVLTPDDRVALFAAVDPGRSAAHGPGTVQRYVRELEPVPDVADLAAALRQAEAWLRSNGEEMEREIHVLTDLQRVSLPASSADDRAQSEGEGISVVIFAPSLDSEPNGAIGNVVAEVMPLGAGQETRVSVPIHWFGTDEPNDSVVVRLVAGGNIVAAAESRFGSSALLRLPPQDSGWVQGYVEIDSHGLTADDRRYFAWFVRPATRVAVVGDGGEFLAHALRALERGKRLEIVAPADADLWFCVAGDQLAEALSSGRSAIVVPPASALDLPLLNRRLTRARIPWRYEPSEPGSGLSRLSEGAPFAGLRELDIQDFYRLTPTGVAVADSVMMRLQGGEAWLVRGTTAGGPAYVLLASPLTAEGSAVPVSSSMVPFVDLLVGSWARHGEIDSSHNLEGASPVQLPPRARTIATATGQTIRAEGGAWFSPPRAGNYTVADDEQVIMAFSVNAPLIEADLEQGSRGSLEAALPAANWSWLRGGNPNSWTDRIFRSRRGRLSWKPLVALLLAFAILEASLAASGRRRETTVRPGSDAQRK